MERDYDNEDIEQLIANLAHSNKIIDHLRHQLHQCRELLEQCAEEIENCYGRETELTKKVRKTFSPSQPSKYENLDKCNHCGDCVHLSITEYQQRQLWKTEKQMKPHVCHKYDRQLLHEQYHPSIPRLSVCIKEKGYTRAIEPTLDSEGVE